MTTGFLYDFLHGVASGDPDEEGAVLWTRISHRFSPSVQSRRVRWTVYRDEDLADVLATGIATASADFDWTCKVVVTGLAASTKYRYRFAASEGDGPSLSPMGTFKTLPAPGAHVERMRYAAFSCSNYGWGYFNAYNHAAKNLDLDFWLHLGDYYYEYGAEHYPSRSEAVRSIGLEPQHECLTLEDYRKRHATYRADPDLQDLSASAAAITIWDDHEVANNQWGTHDAFGTWHGGAENHDPKTEGSFLQRKRAAIQAYHEWLPTRTAAFGEKGYVGERYFRKFHFGDLADLLILETRMLNRTNPDEKGNLLGQTAQAIASVQDVRALPPQVETNLLRTKTELEEYRRRPNKSLLSQDEYRWIRSEMAASVETGTTWQLLSQEIVVADLKFANLDEAVVREEREGDTSTANQWREEITSSMCANGSAEARILAPSAYLASVRERTVNLTERDCLANRAGFLHGAMSIPYNLDMWSGYLKERERLFDAIRESKSQNAVFYSGDSHNAWASNLRDGRGGFVAAEYAGTSVTSTGWEDFAKNLSPRLIAAGFAAANPDLVYANTKDRGLMVFELTHEKHSGEFVYVSTVSDRAYQAFCESRLDYYSSARGTKRSQGLVLGECKSGLGGGGDAPSSDKSAVSIWWVSAPVVIALVLVAVLGALLVWRRKMVARRKQRYLEVSMADLQGDEI